jgi:ubiquinone/menaquinone biosynthesis C-methylase UbiE
MTGSRLVQHEAWASGRAADAYFARNPKALDGDLNPSRSTRLFASYIRAANRVLEIGSSNGRVLEQLRRLAGCEAHGIDPSPAAVEDGISRFPDLRLSVGTAERIAYGDGFFDVVILGFCLYLVDRALLQRVVAETDRVLADGGGRLMITDFDSPQPHRRAYRYEKGLWSYKMQYANLWLANPSYILAEKLAFNHESEEFHADPGERLASWILVKHSADSYPVWP